jgi:hypothetical protein
MCATAATAHFPDRRRDGRRIVVGDLLARCYGPQREKLAPVPQARIRATTVIEAAGKIIQEKVGSHADLQRVVDALPARVDYVNQFSARDRLPVENMNNATRLDVCRSKHTPAVYACVSYFQRNRMATFALSRIYLTRFIYTSGSTFIHDFIAHSPNARPTPLRSRLASRRPSRRRSRAGRSPRRSAGRGRSNRRTAPSAARPW